MTNYGIHLILSALLLCGWGTGVNAQQALVLDRVVQGGIIQTTGMGSISWLKDGERYTSIESNKDGKTEIVSYTAKDNIRKVLVPDSLLINP